MKYIKADDLIKAIETECLYNQDGESLIKNESFNKLKWVDPKIPGHYGDIYLVYRKGLPLMVAQWETGHGYINIATGLSIQNPELVAVINLPEIN